MLKILYLCTHNRCRSILCEALSQHLGEGKIEARSAGSQAVKEVHPLTLKYLKEEGIATQHLKSKSWDELSDFKPDVVITVCDSAAGETCPLWLGNSLKIHWGLEDPSSIEDATQSEAAFKKTIEIIKQRIEHLKAIDFSKKDTQLLKEDILNIKAKLES